MTTPSASSTSAVPQADEAARLPCLIIRVPAAAAAIVPMVEMLTVRAPSAPVPTRSTVRPGIEIGAAWSSMAWASPVTSPAVSPFIRSATPKPAIWTGVAAPSMISFIAHAVSSAVSVSPRISAPIRAGQAVRGSIYGPLDPVGFCGTGAASVVSALGARGSRSLLALAHQAGQCPGECHRVDRMADDGVGPGPGSQPAVVGPADDQQDRGTVMNLVLGLAADAHPAGGLGLAVQHHDVDSATVEQPEHHGLGGDLDNLRLGHVRGGTTADGEPDPAPSVGIMAIHGNLHGKGCYRAGGSGYAR